MNEREQKRGILYTVVCGSGYAPAAPDFIKATQVAGWETCAILTPMATRFVEATHLAQLTGYPVRSEYKQLGDPDVLPRADAVIVFGATFNTINKWALGISDTLALGVLCELTGLRVPILAIPVVRRGGGLDTHRAFPRSVRMLRSYGVHIFYDPEAYPPRNEVPHAVILRELHRIVESWSE